MIEYSAMSEFLQPNDLDIQLHEAFFELGIDEEIKKSALELLNPLKEKDPIHKEHYEHCVRVGLLASQIGGFMNLDQKALFFSGLFHDLGKQEIDEELLGKTDPWTQSDYEAIQKHPLIGHELLRGKFDFSAEIILLHHTFQKDGYPKDLPPFLHDYSEGTKTLISEYARVLAIADVYDALHRENSKFGEKRKLSDQEIEDYMLEHNPDRKELIESLYRAGIFINKDKSQESDVQRQIYEEIWTEIPKRTPRETGRQVVLAAALEPIADKRGNTTRFSNASRFLKLEYFITAGINLGESFENLAERIDALVIQPEVIYDLALKAQKDSLRNRSGGRVNQGIIELLMPIVASQHLFNSDNTLATEEVLARAIEVLSNTSSTDIEKLRQMKRLAFNMSAYTTREVPEYPEACNVLDYYQQDLVNSTNPTSIAHNGEFVNGFPTIKLIYDELSDFDGNFSDKIERAYRKALIAHDPNVGRGFIADCIAAGIYLYLSQNPKAKLVV